MPSENNEKLTEEQVWDVLQLSDAIYKFATSNNLGGVYSPYTQNYNLRSLVDAPVKIDQDEFIKAVTRGLEDPEELRKYSQFMQFFDAIYAKTIRYYETMLAFDYSWQCINASGADWKSKEYKEDEQRVKKFFTRFDVQNEFGNKIVPIVLKNQVFYGWFRDSHGTISDTGVESLEYDIKRDSKYAIQVMPQDRCKITDYSNVNFLYDFDVSYFLNSSVDIQLYDPSFIDKYKQVYLNNAKDVDYIPHAQFDARNGVYAQWVQTSPRDGAICVKLSQDSFDLVPPFVSLMKPTIDNHKIHQLQMDKNVASAWAILYGNIGMMDKEKGGNIKNQTKFEPNTLKEFMKLVSTALDGMLKTVALPLEDSRFGQFSDSNTNMEVTGLANSARQGAFGSSLIFTDSTNQTVVQNAIIADYNFLSKKLYPQFESILNYYVNKKTKKFKFKISISGSNFPFEREYRRKGITELADRGLVLPPQHWASAYGYDPVMFVSAVEQSHNCDYDNYLTTMINRNTMKDGDGESMQSGGRPQKDQKSDATITYEDSVKG